MGMVDAEFWIEDYGMTRRLEIYPGFFGK